MFQLKLFSFFFKLLSFLPSFSLGSDILSNFLNVLHRRDHFPIKIPLDLFNRIHLLLFSSSHRNPGEYTTIRTQRLVWRWVGFRLSFHLLTSAFVGHLFLLGELGYLLLLFFLVAGLLLKIMIAAIIAYNEHVLLLLLCCRCGHALTRVVTSHCILSCIIFLQLLLSCKRDVVSWLRRLLVQVVGAHA